MPRPADLIKLVLILKYISRLPLIASVSKLDQRGAGQILTEPRNALVKQYQKLFELDGVEARVHRGRHPAIADQAMERGTGARGLRAIIEEVLLHVMYDVPSRGDVAKVIVTGEVVHRRRRPDPGAARVRTEEEVRVTSRLISGGSGCGRSTVRRWSASIVVRAGVLRGDGARRAHRRRSSGGLARHTADGDVIAGPCCTRCPSASRRRRAVARRRQRCSAGRPAVAEPARGRAPTGTPRARRRTRRPRRAARRAERRQRHPVTRRPRRRSPPRRSRVARPPAVPAAPSTPAVRRRRRAGRCPTGARAARHPRQREQPRGSVTVRVTACGDDSRPRRRRRSARPRRARLGVGERDHRCALTATPTADGTVAGDDHGSRLATTRTTTRPRRRPRRRRPPRPALSTLTALTRLSPRRARARRRR